MPHDPIAASGRRHRRTQELGPNARCIMCGTSNPDVLRQSNRQLFEAHHALGRAHAPELTCVACLNCHAIFSAAQTDDGVVLSHQATFPERVLAILGALGSFLRVLGEMLLALADHGQASIRGLDANVQLWRDQPWARA